MPRRKKKQKLDYAAGEVERVRCAQSRCFSGGATLSLLMKFIGCGLGTHGGGALVASGVAR